METDILMVNNSSVLIDNVDDLGMAKFSDFPNSSVGAQALEKKFPATQIEVADVSHTQREVGDEVNRFLLCTLVSVSAKRIKAGAEKAGESLPMAMIVRGVLRSYRLAAKDKYGPLSKPKFDAAGLSSLNEKVLKDEIARHSRDRVKNSQTRLAQAERLGDDTKIRAEKEELTRAIELRDRLSKGSR